MRNFTRCILAVKHLERTAMENSHFRKELGSRIKALRKQKLWSQKQMAEKLGIPFRQLNKYESAQNLPPADKLLLMAEVLGTSVDYLLTGNLGTSQTAENRLLERLRIVQKLKPEDQDAVIRLLDALLVKHRLEGVLQGVNSESIAVS